jgi:hypothetical protein
MEITKLLIMLFIALIVGIILSPLRLVRTFLKITVSALSGIIETAKNETQILIDSIDGRRPKHNQRAS